MTGSNSPVSNTTPHCMGFRILFQPPSLSLDVEFQGVGSIPQASAGQQFAGQQYDFGFIWFCGALKSLSGNVWSAEDDTAVRHSNIFKL